MNPHHTKLCMINQHQATCPIVKTEIFLTDATHDAGIVFPGLVDMITLLYTDQLALTNNFFHLLWSVVTHAAFNMVYLCSSSNKLCLIRWNMYPRLYSTLQASLTWSSLVFCSWLAYSFLLSSICCLLMLEFILCFSTSARDRFRSASALLYASRAFSLAPKAFSYFSLVLARFVRDNVSWDWIRAPSWRN